MRLVGGRMGLARVTCDARVGGSASLLGIRHSNPGRVVGVTRRAELDLLVQTGSGTSSSPGGAWARGSGS